MCREWKDATVNFDRSQDVSRPSKDDVASMEVAGLRLDENAQVRDKWDVAFSGEWFEIMPIDGDVDDIRPARVCAYFEPKAVGFVEDNWNCGIELEDDFWSAAGGSWPDCFALVEDALACIESYFEEGGLLERRGWKVV